MNNPFKEIEPKEKPSKELREKVLGDFDKLSLTLDLAELFLVIQPQVLSTFFKNKNKS